MVWRGFVGGGVGVGGKNKVHCYGFGWLSSEASWYCSFV